MMMHGGNDVVGTVRTHLGKKMACMEHGDDERGRFLWVVLCRLGVMGVNFGSWRQYDQDVISDA